MWISSLTLTSLPGQVHVCREAVCLPGSLVLVRLCWQRRWLGRQMCPFSAAMEPTLLNWWVGVDQSGCGSCLHRLAALHLRLSLLTRQTPQDHAPAHVATPSVAKKTERLISCWRSWTDLVRVMNPLWYQQPPTLRITLIRRYCDKVGLIVRLLLTCPMWRHGGKFFCTTSIESAPVILQGELRMKISNHCP